MSARTNQPQGTARVDWGNPITQDLRYLFNGGTGARELVRGVSPGSATQLFGPARNGAAFVGNGSSRVMDLGVLGSIASLTGGSTLMAIVDFPTLTATTSTICSFVDGAAIRSVSLHANDGTNSNLVAGGYNNVNTWTAYVSPNNLVAGRRYVIIATYNANTTLQTCEINDVSTTTAAITFALGEACSIGARRTAPATYNSYFNGNIYMVALWQRQLPRNERAALAANPWQLMAPLAYPAIVTMPVGGGGTIYDVTVLDTAGAVDLIVGRLDGYITPSTDVTANGWVPTNAATVAAALASRGTSKYGTSPDLAASYTGEWQDPVPAGSRNLVFTAQQTATAGQLRIVMLDSSNAVQGTSAWQTLTSSIADYTLAVTTTGVSTRFRIEVQP